MDLMELGTSLIKSKLGGNANGDIGGALGNLFGGSGGGFDLGGLVSNMMGGGLGDTVSSWLGDGDNDPISSDQVKELFGSDKVSAFANELGVDEDTAADTLADAVPQMVDKSSSGGSLLDMVGGMDGVMDMAKKLF
ncbi:MAG TPA: DUF937 domain-containing protein [Chromatiaceae bacterium]|nr:DUF937 domain-containing protein [Chromatiaceae bacterium]